MIDPCVCFTWCVYHHATVCTVRNTVCTMCSTTHPCSMNGSLMTMEVKIKIKIGEKYRWIGGPQICGAGRY